MRLRRAGEDVDAVDDDDVTGSGRAVGRESPRTGILRSAAGERETGAAAESRRGRGG